MRRQGFTLAETLFAMAIVAFTLLTIVGMMPGGMTTLQSSERRAAESRILQTLANEYQAKPWRELERLRSHETEVKYFDGTGLPLITSNEGALYAAVVERAQDDNNLLFPNERQPIGDEARSLDVTRYLMHLRVIIVVRHTPQDESLLFSDRQNDAKRREFGFVVVNPNADS